MKQIPYSKFNEDEMILRDWLATDRTRLAIQRTLLSFIRTAIIFIGGGITLLKTFPNDTIVVVFAVCLIPIGIFFALFGLFNHFRSKKNLAQLLSK